MHLSKYTDYSFRVLMYLGTNNSRLVTIGEISKSYNISKNHLVKIVHQLAVSGIIDSVPGKNGGIRLGKDPKKIKILDVIELTETNFDLAECFTKNGFCPIQANCRLTNILTEALFAFFKVISKYSLQDLIKNEPIRLQLKSLAKIEL